jgi:hypothetical protein
MGSNEFLLSADILSEANHGQPLQDLVQLTVSVVRLPVPGNVVFDAMYGIDESLWTTLPQRAQELSAESGAMRAIIAQVPALVHFENCMRLDKAASLNVTVLNSLDMLGYFTLPTFDFGNLLGSPKGKFSSNASW